MAKHLVAAVGILALAGGGYARQLAITDGDSQFLKTVAEADMAEVSACKLVLSKTSDAGLKKACRMMITDHGRNLSEVKRLAKKYNVLLPVDASDDHKALYGRLQGEDGDMMNKDLVGAQLGDHMKAIHLFEDEAKSGTTPDVVRMDKATLPALHKHLGMWKMLAGRFEVPVPEDPGH